MTLDSVVSPLVLNKYLTLVDVKSGRFKYQSVRAVGKAKKRESPAKSRRVGICVIVRGLATLPKIFLLSYKPTFLIKKILID